MRRCLVSGALSLLMLALPNPGAAGEQGLCVLGGADDGRRVSTVEPVDLAVVAAAAPFAHEVLGDDAIAAPGHYPLGAMLLRPRGGATSLSTHVEPAAEQALIQMQLLLYRDACARRIGRTLQTSEDAYLRMPVALDYVSRQRAPIDNMRLQAGDILYLPPLPSSVLVVGAVASPGAVDFQPAMDAREYIQAAGGWGRGADRSETFVYLPDGKRRALSATFWNYERRNIPPGSVIVVPGRGIDLARQHQALHPEAVPARGDAAAEYLPTLRLDPQLRESAPEPDEASQ